VNANDDPFEEDEIEYEIFYKKIEIQEAKENQKVNLFEEIVKGKDKGQERFNKINIADYAPEDPVEIMKKAMRKKLSRVEDENKEIDEEK